MCTRPTQTLSQKVPLGLDVATSDSRRSRRSGDRALPAPQAKISIMRSASARQGDSRVARGSQKRTWNRRRWPRHSTGPGKRRDSKWAFAFRTESASPRLYARLPPRDILGAPMKTVLLMARKLDSSPVGNKYMLAIGVIGSTPDSSSGLSRTPISDHSYPTLENLCHCVSAARALDAHILAALRKALQNDEPYYTEISEESAVCMGFELP